MRKIYLRADGNSLIGLGHIYRLLALGEILKDDFRICFVTNSLEEFLLDAISQSVDELIQLDVDHSYLLPNERKKNDEVPFDITFEINKNDIVVTDGYWFGKTYQKAIKNCEAKLVCIDDLVDSTYYFSDVVINHAPGLLSNQFASESYTKFCLGIDYCILRKVFFEPIPLNKKKNAIFVGFGGSDYFDFSLKSLESLLSFSNFERIDILVTDYFSQNSMKKLSDFANTHPDKIKLHKNLSAETIKNILDECSHAIVSASTILFECYSRGLQCFTGYYAVNQKSIYDGFVKSEMAVGLGDLATYDFNLLEKSLSGSGSMALNTSLKSIHNLKNVFQAL